MDFLFFYTDIYIRMNKRVNFEDNIFILMMRIRMIRDIIILDADPELFLEKTLDDICFADQTLRTLLGFIKDNNQLIERDELLEHLSEAEWQFSQVVGSLLNHNGNLSIRGAGPIREKLIAFQNSSLERRKTAEYLTPDEGSLSGSPIVSSDELTELLKAL